MRSKISHFGMAAAPAILGMHLMASAPAFAQDETVFHGDNDSAHTTQSTIRLEPRAPLDTDTGLIGGGIAGGLALAFGAYAMRRRIKVAPPYILAGGAIALTLLNPVRVESDLENIPNDIVVIVDKSASNMIGARAEITERVRAHVMEQMQEFDNVNIRLVQVENSRDLLDGGGTALFETLRDMEGLHPDHLSGLVVITDGQIHDVPSVSPFGQAVPVHTFLSGAPDEIDRVVELVGASSFGMLDEEQIIRFRVNDVGAGLADNARIPVRVMGDNNVLQTLYATPGEIMDARVTITTPGMNVFSIEADSLAGELTEANNRVVVDINGIRDSLNVLMISGVVNNSVRNLRDIYKADPDSNLIHMMSMRLPRHLDDTPRSELSLTPVPLNEIFGEALEKYDLIVFNNFENLNVLPARYLRSIAERTREDGALLVVAGPEFAGSKSIASTALGDILPVTPTGEMHEELFTPQLTDEGFRHPVTSGLRGAGDPESAPDWGPWIRVMGADVNAGRVLMETPSGAPLLVINEVEKSRVAVLLSDSFPLWSDGFGGGGPDTQMLNRVSHWLMGTHELEEEALRVRQTQDRQLVIERQTMAEDAPPPASLIVPGGQEEQIEFTTEISPGVWQGTYNYTLEGVYKIAQDHGDHTLSAYINAGQDMGKEMSFVTASAGAMRSIADETGGGIFYTVKEDGTIFLPDLRQMTPSDTQNGGAGIAGAYAGNDWAGFAQKEIQELRGLEKNPLIPAWATALFVASMMVWGWSRESDHNKIKKLGAGILPRRRDEVSAPAADNTPEL